MYQLRRCLIFGCLWFRTFTLGHKHRRAHPNSQNTLAEVFGGEEGEYSETYGPQADLPFSGPLSFAHLPYTRCLDDKNTKFDVAILGLPFDTAVSYRPGARFGPFGIRSGSRRLRHDQGYSLAWESIPYMANGTTVIDCGDVPVTPYDNLGAMDQIESAYLTLLQREVDNTCGQDRNASCVSSLLALDGKSHPRIVTLGGDHAIVLPILRALNKVYGPITVIHFDSHLDTWPEYNNYLTEDTSLITHGTFFWSAQREGLLRKNSCVHAGIRCKLNTVEDISNDAQVGFEIITTDDIDEIGTKGIVKLIRDRVGTGPVYLSFDIDVIDPAIAPARTPEPAGWTPREVHRIIRGLAGLNFVGADLVEVAPAYDTNAETTGIVAAAIIHEFISMMIADSPPVGYRSALRRQLPFE